MISKLLWKFFAITQHREHYATMGVTWIIFLSKVTVPFLDLKANLRIWMQHGKFQSTITNILPCKIDVMVRPWATFFSYTVGFSLVVTAIKKYFSGTHDVCYAIEAFEGAERASRSRCDNNLGRNLNLACKYIINSKGLTFDQCLRKANLVAIGCNLFCSYGFEIIKKQCQTVN